MALPARSRPMETMVHFEPGSASLGVDCHATLPLAMIAARCSPPPLGLAITASNSFSVLVSTASSPSLSSQAWASCACAGSAAAAANRMAAVNRMVRLRFPARRLSYHDTPGAYVIMAPHERVETRAAVSRPG